MILDVFLLSFVVWEMMMFFGGVNTVWHGGALMKRVTCKYRTW